MYTVSCLSCQHSESREQLQARIIEENPDWCAVPQEFTPDADAVVPEEFVLSFKTPSCPKCREDLKPDVVFFGESVPRERVELVNKRLSEADACLVLGTSLQTFSALRHVKQARELGLPILVMNIGPTREENLADIHVRGRCGEAFEWLAKTPPWTDILS
jgi:NAD-dependent deacetylase sirtuin 4